jgi:GntR family transcriptional regulator
MIILDYTDGRPIYEQVVERFQSLVLCGVLEKDAPLPSVRNLAMELSINPNTIQRAYTELERRGVIYAVKGKGNFVADMKPLLALREKEVKDEAYHLVRKAKEAGMTRELLNRLLDGAWNETGKTAVSEAAQESKKETMQQAASELGVGGEADD